MVNVTLNSSGPTVAAPPVGDVGEAVPGVAFVGAGTALGRVAALVEALVGELATLSLVGAEREALRGLIVGLGRVRAGVDAAEARAVVAVDALGDGGVDALEVLRRGTGCSQRIARRSRWRAGVLAKMPRVGAALAVGDISAEHVDALVRAAEAISPEAVDGDGELLGMVAGCPADLAGRRVQGWVQRRLHPDDAHKRHQRHRRARRLSFGENDDGMPTAYAAFDQVQGAEFRRRIDDIADRLWRAEGGRDNPNGRSIAQRRLDALIIACGLARPPSPAPPAPASDQQSAQPDGGGAAPGSSAGTAAGRRPAQPDGGGAVPGSSAGTAAGRRPAQPDRSGRSGDSAGGTSGPAAPASHGGPGGTRDTRESAAARGGRESGPGRGEGESAPARGARRCRGAAAPAASDGSTVSGGNDGPGDGAVVPGGAAAPGAGCDPRSGAVASGGGATAPGQDSRHSANGSEAARGSGGVTGAAGSDGSASGGTCSTCCGSGLRWPERAGVAPTAGSDPAGAGSDPAGVGSDPAAAVGDIAGAGRDPAGAGSDIAGSGGDPVSGGGGSGAAVSVFDPGGIDAAWARATAGWGRATSARHQVIVVASSDVISGKDPNGRCELLGAGPIPQSELERLACDAEFFGVLFGGRGDPLWVGRRTRTATEAQRRALMARDGACVLCAAHHSQCDAHHIVPWAKPSLGRTDIDNLALLCGTCHRRLHDAKRILVRRSDQTWTTAPDPRHAKPPPRAASGPSRAAGQPEDKAERLSPAGAAVGAHPPPRADPQSSGADAPAGAPDPRHAKQPARAAERSGGLADSPSPASAAVGTPLSGPAGAPDVSAFGAELADAAALSARAISDLLWSYRAADDDWLDAVVAASRADPCRGDLQRPVAAPPVGFDPPGNAETHEAGSGEIGG